jgi:hypothetical protein
MVSIKLVNNYKKYFLKKFFLLQSGKSVLKETRLYTCLKHFELNKQKDLLNFF